MIIEDKIFWISMCILGIVAIFIGVSFIIGDEIIVHKYNCNYNFISESDLSYSCCDYLANPVQCSYGKLEEGDKWIHLLH